VPSKVNVAIGSTVTWKNVDTAAHTVTDTNGAFDSSLVIAKGSFKHKFDTAGTYNYMCIVHPWMQGTVTVS
jgi:plastocyanin